MKFCILSRPRTLSSFFTYSLAEFHGLSNKFETYNRLANKLLLVKQSCNLSKQKPNYLSNLRSEITHITNDMFLESNFVCKIFPRHFILFENRLNSTDPNYYRLDTISETEFCVLTDYYNLFRLSDYDHIYFLDRNLYDSVSSYVYAIKTKTFAQKYKKTHILHKPITVTALDYPHINIAILEYVVGNMIKNQLVDRPNITFLTDDIVQEYVEKNFKPTLSTYKQSLDYNCLISNRNELCDYIDTNLPKLIGIVQNSWCPGEDSNLHAQGSGF